MDANDKKDSIEAYYMWMGYMKEAGELNMKEPEKVTVKPPEAEENIINNKPRLKDYSAKSNTLLPTKMAETAFMAGYDEENGKVAGMLSTGIKTISGIGSKIMGSKIGLGASELIKSPAVQKMKPIATKAITGATVLGSANTALSHGNTFKPMSMPKAPSMPSMPGMPNMPKLAEEAFSYGYEEEMAEMQKNAVMGMQTMGKGINFLRTAISPARSLASAPSIAASGTRKYIQSGASKIRADRFGIGNAGRKFNTPKVNINNSEVPIKSAPKPVAPAQSEIISPAERVRQAGRIDVDTPTGFTKLDNKITSGNIRNNQSFGDPNARRSTTTGYNAWREGLGKTNKPIGTMSGSVNGPRNQSIQEAASNIYNKQVKMPTINPSRGVAPTAITKADVPLKSKVDDIVKEFEAGQPQATTPTHTPAKSTADVVQNMGKETTTTAPAGKTPSVSAADQKILDDQNARIIAGRKTMAPGVTEVEGELSPVEKVRLWGRKKTQTTEAPAPAQAPAAATPPPKADTPVAPAAEVPSTPAPATEEVAKTPGRWGTRMKWGLGGLTVGGLGAGILTQGQDKNPNQTYYG